MELVLRWCCASAAVWGSGHCLQFRTEHIQPICPLSRWSPPQSQVTWYNIKFEPSPEFSHVNLLLIQHWSRWVGDQRFGELIYQSSEDSAVEAGVHLLHISVGHVMINRQTSFSFICRKYKDWHLFTVLSVLTHRALIPLLLRSIWTMHTPELLCTSVPRPRTGSSAGNRAVCLQPQEQYSKNTYEYHLCMTLSSVTLCSH